MKPQQTTDYLKSNVDNNELVYTPGISEHAQMPELAVGLARFFESPGTFCNMLKWV